MKELILWFLVLLLLIGILVYGCAGSPRTAGEAIDHLTSQSRSLGSLAAPGELDTAADIPPGMRYGGVDPSGHVDGRAAAIVPQDSPSTARPWEVVFAWPTTGGQRYLLLSSELAPREILPGFMLVGASEWVLPIDAMTETIGYDWQQQAPHDDRLVTYGKFSFTPEWAGSEWWAQVLWWDGADTIVLSGGWWFRIGNV